MSTEKTAQPVSIITDSILSPFLDTSKPNTARIFNYLLGGSAHFEVDRQAAKQLLTVLPSLDRWVQLRHAFALEAAQQLAEQGFNQFLDLGSGMPTDDHMHTFLSESRIIYSDINPVAVSYGNSLFAELENVLYIHGDVTNVENILQAAPVRRLMNMAQKIAIGLNSVSIFLSESDNQKLSQALYKWAPVGSKVYVVFQTLETSTPQYEEFLAINNKAGLPLKLYTLQQSIDMLKPWHLARLEPIAEFLGLPEDYISDSDRTSFGFDFHAAFLEKEPLN
jgi:hypothetical protein